MDGGCLHQRRRLLIPHPSQSISKCSSSKSNKLTHWNVTHHQLFQSIHNVHNPSFPVYHKLTYTHMSPTINSLVYPLCSQPIFPSPSLSVVNHELTPTEIATHSSTLSVYSLCSQPILPSPALCHKLTYTKRSLTVNSIVYPLCSQPILLSPALTVVSQI